MNRPNAGQRARGWALDHAYAAGWGAVRAVPEPIARRAFDRVADWATARDGAGVRQLRKNLRRVVGPELPEPELDELVAQAMRSYARYWRETFRLPRMDLAEVARRAEQGTIGVSKIDAIHASGRGYVLALPHSGNWDVAGIWLVERTGSPFTTVAERLKPESLFDRFVAYRERLGFEIVPLTGGRPPTEPLIRRLKSGGCVCLMAERDLSRRGVEVEFFGATARFPPGPALLAAQTGAALLPVITWYEPDGGWGQQVIEEIPLTEKRLADKVRGGTQRLATAFEGLIRKHPADWHMLQRLWSEDFAPVRPGD